MLEHHIILYPASVVLLRELGQRSQRRVVITNKFIDQPGAGLGFDTVEVAKHIHHHVPSVLCFRQFRNAA